MSYKYKLFILLLLLQGCSSLSIKNTVDSNSQKNNIYVDEIPETIAGKYERKKKVNVAIIESASISEQHIALKRKVQHMIMDLLSQIDSHSQKKTIMLNMVDFKLSQDIDSYTESEIAHLDQTKSLIRFLLMQELVEFGFTVIDIFDASVPTDLIFETQVGEYNSNYLMNFYIKDLSTKKILSTMHTSFSPNLFQLEKDGIWFKK